MFDVSLPEFVLVLVIGLLVLGPQRLPKVAAEIGKWVGRARRTATQLRRQLEREIELSELAEPPPSRPPSPESGAAAAPAEEKSAPPAPANEPAEPKIAVPTSEAEAVRELYGGSSAPSSPPRPERSDEPSPH